MKSNDVLKSPKIEKELSCKLIEIITRQTNYTDEIAKQKLEEFNNDHLLVIKDYLGISVKKPDPIKSINQEIYKQMRNNLYKSKFI